MAAATGRGSERDRGREEREREIGGEREEQNGEDKNMEGGFVNSCQPDTTWHATSALEAGVARLRP